MHGKVAVVEARDQMECAEEQEMSGEKEGKRTEQKTKEEEREEKSNGIK